MCAKPISYWISVTRELLVVAVAMQGWLAAIIAGQCVFTLDRLIGRY